MEEEGPRKKISFQQRDINILEVCPFANLLLASSTNEKVITIWNYDNLKLAYKIQFISTITGMQILTDKQLFVVTTLDGYIYFFMYMRKQAKLKISLLAKFDINNVIFGEVVDSDQAKQDQEDKLAEDQSFLILDGKTYANKIAYCEDNNMLVFSTPKGALSCFEPTNFLINSNYRREYEPTPILKRPMKQSFEHELLKKQFIEYNAEEM